MRTDFDFPTLLMVFAVIRILQAAGLVYVWHVHRQFVSLGIVALGSVLLAVAAAVFSTGVLPFGGWETIAGILLTGLGIAIFAGGMIGLADRDPPWKLALAWVAAALLSRLIFTFVAPSNLAGVLGLTIYVAGFDGYAAVCLWRAPAGPLRGTRRWIAAVLIAEVVCAAGRAGILIGSGVVERAPRVGSITGSGLAQSLFMFASIAAAFLITLLVVVLTNQRLQAALQEAADRDPLTGLLNRRAFAKKAEIGWAQSTGTRSPLSILLIDLDHFKAINDLYGHVIGDVVLQEVSNVLVRETRFGDAICRFGGEEFLLLLPATPLHEAELVAERLRGAVGSMRIADVPHLPVSVSIGVAERSAADGNWERLVAVSDKALYVAKENGRNKVIVAERSQLAAA